MKTSTLQHIYAGTIETIQDHTYPAVTNPLHETIVLTKIISCKIPIPDHKRHSCPELRDSFKERKMQEV